MKFRYYITDTMNGMVQGTDSQTVARDFANSEDYFVVDSDTGLWLNASGEEFDVQDVEQT